MFRAFKRIERSLKRAFWALAVWGESPSKHTLGPSPSILVLRPDRLGDFVLSIPALLTLQETMGPQGRMTLAAGGPNEGLARLFFPTARILVFRKNILSRLFFYLRILFGHFDAVVDLHSYPFSTTTAWMCLLSGAPLRVGFADPNDWADVSRRVFNVPVSAPSEILHEAQKGFRLVQALYPEIRPVPTPKVGLPSLPVEAVRKAEEFYHAQGVAPGTRVIALHPTLTKKDNRWPMECYLSLVRRWPANKNVRFLVIHGRGEEASSKRFQSETKDVPGLLYLPGNDLLFILAALRRAEVLVCGDSGIMHAAALVTPVVAVFGPSDPKRWGPLPIRRPGKGHLFLRKKDKSCGSVGVEEVRRAILSRRGK